MTRWRLPFFGFVLACLAPGLRFLGQNVGEFSWMGVSAVTAVLVCCVLVWGGGLLVAAGPALLVRRWPVARALTVGIVAVTLLFAQEALRVRLMDVWSLSQVDARLWFVVASVVVLAGVVWGSKYEPVRVGLTLMAALLAVLPLVGVARLAVAMVRPVTNTPAGTQPQVRQALSGENVYYVILDGYAGPKTVARIGAGLPNAAAFTLQPFFDRMATLGFTPIADARSNYVTTHLSLMAILQMDYPVDTSSPRYVDRRAFFPQAFQSGPLPRVVQDLTQGGYDFYHVGNYWAPCRARAEVRCLRNASTIGFYQHIAEAFLAPTKLLPALGLVRYTSRADAITPLVDVLPELVQQERPFFMFVHHLSPHEAATPAVYGEALARDNVLVERLAARIQALDPGALVVFQADHGSEFQVQWTQPLSEWTEAAIDERTDILNLARLPEPCRAWVRPGLSQINTMRLVTGCLVRRPPDYLPDRSFLNAYEANPDFGTVRDVTVRRP